MVATKENRLIESHEELKYVEISGDKLQELTRNLRVACPEELRREGGIFIGPATMLHYAILARDLGLDPEKLSENQRLSLTNAKYLNAGRLINLGVKSLLTGTSMTLYNETGVPFTGLAGTVEKKNLDEATCRRLNQIYQGTWVFVTEP